MRHFQKPGFHWHPFLAHHPRLRRYVKGKMIALLAFALALYLMKRLFQFELPETYMSLVEHASLLCDVIFVGSNSE